MKVSDIDDKVPTNLKALISSRRDKRRAAREAAQSIGVPAIPRIVELFEDASKPGKVNLLVTLRNIIRTTVPEQPSEGDDDDSDRSPWILKAVADFKGRDQIIDFLRQIANDADFAVRRSAALCLLVVEPYIFARIDQPSPILDPGDAPSALEPNVHELGLQLLYCWSAGCGSTTAGGHEILNPHKHWSADDSLKADNFFAQIIALARESRRWLYTEEEYLGGDPASGFATSLGLDSSQAEIDTSVAFPVPLLVHSLADEPDEDDDFRGQFIFLSSDHRALAKMLGDSRDGIHPEILINMAMEGVHMRLPEDETSSHAILVEAIVEAIRDGRWRDTFMTWDCGYEFYWAKETVHTQAIQALGWIADSRGREFLSELYADKSADRIDRLAAVYGLAPDLVSAGNLNVDLLFAGESVRENLELLRAWWGWGDGGSPTVDREFTKQLWLGCTARSITDLELLQSIAITLMLTDQFDLAIDCLHNVRKIAMEEGNRPLVSKIASNLADAYSLSKTKLSVDDLLRRGEDRKLEIKGSLGLNLTRAIHGDGEHQDEEMIKGALKTIVAFLNTCSGTLLIGILERSRFPNLPTEWHDKVVEKGDYYILGIEDELGKDSLDDYQLRLRDLVRDHIAKDIGADLIRVTFPPYDGKTLCRIEIERPAAGNWYYLNYLNSQFFVRQGNKTEELKGQDADNYKSRKLGGGGARIS